MNKKIIFTKNASDQIEKITSETGPNTYFRITVKGGGCSGFKYNFDLVEKINSNDTVINKTLIDQISFKYLEGSTVDYKKEMIGSSFIIENPKAKMSCGCGLSFSL